MFKFCLGLVPALFLLVACTEESKSVALPQSAPLQGSSVQVVKVQHILIGFAGSIPGKKIERSPEEAKRLAEDLFAQAQAAPDKFEDLVRAKSDDQVPGIYELVDFGKAPHEGQFSRGTMVQGFGDLAFRLKPGEIGLVAFDSKKSPFGFHIMKRLAP